MKANTEQSWLDWYRITAFLSSLIGIAGLVALLFIDARAEAPKGFPTGPRVFGGAPFANTPGAAADDPFFDDEDEEDFEFTPPANRGGPAAANPGARPADTTKVQRMEKGIEVGGGPAGGVISTNNPPAIKVDNDTGEGSKEIVTDFNFPDADILDIAKTLGKLTGKNFILDKDVKGRITIISNSAITVGDAWRAFLTALDINGFAMIPSGSYIRIARQRDARDKQLKTFVGDRAPETDSLITRVFQLKYIDAEEVARTFRSFMPANSRIMPYQQTNTVIVTDTGSNIAKLYRLLEILDVEGFDAGIEVIPVKFASAMELSKLIDTLLPGTGGSPGAPAGGQRFGSSTNRFSARRTKEGGIINTIIADDRTNTLIVHANSRGANQVRELVTTLDQRVPTPTGGGKVHVLPLQFADAEQLAQTLNNISSGQTGRPAGGPLGGTGVNPVSASLFEGQIKVSPDKATNALVITASPADFGTMQRVIAKLDIPRDEIFVEVVIMDVSINRDFQFSTNVANPANFIAFTPNTDLLSFVQEPLAQKGAILGFKSGGTIDIPIGGKVIPVSNVQGLIKAIQTNTNSNILATPQIIALDNTEATFESTEKIPLPVSTAVQGAGVATSIQRENVSLSIKIKPQINKISSFVKLDVETKLAGFSNRTLPTAVQGLALALLERSAKTTVVVGDGDTIVIGGLMRDNVNDTVSKIPILGDIPLLGWLFRAKSTTVEKTNLLIFLTPHVVRQYEKVRAILDKKLKERDDFIERNAGGDDPLRHRRDEMIRSLPDIKELSAKKNISAFTLEDENGPAAVPVDPPPASRSNSSKSTNTEPNAAPPTVPAPDAPAPPAGGSS
ncbi:MAG: type II secretion system protein GspD [Bdellovibrionales bacterium GWB1_52_6]|nr:MAG: type II secretion system protein GspD [Bdellovibrionales bacterium GWB1_52_6]OFZ06076.1 MAG: type II secretion system protein GspD [Bdellovibrionales bacterium GWA1_52_35]HCM39298.1 type II secretion system protein GspD [Bdellovibrionales bacterium]